MKLYYLDNSGNSISNPLLPHPPTPAICQAHLGSAHIDPADNDTQLHSHELKPTHLLKLLARSWKPTTCQPKLWEQDPFMVLLCNFALSSYSANSTSKITRYVEDDTEKSICPLLSEKHCSRLFQLCHPDPIEPQGFRILLYSLKNSKPTLEPMIQLEKQKPIEDFACMKAIRLQKYFIKFQQLATCIQWGNAALWSGLQWTCKMHQDDMIHHDKLTTLAGLWKLI